MVIIKVLIEIEMMLYTFTGWEAKVGIPLSLRPAWSS